LFEYISRIAGTLAKNHRYRIVTSGNYSAGKRDIFLKGFIIPRVITPDSMAKKQERKPEKYSLEVSLPDHTAKLTN
jgi:hypothetical protein